MIHIISISISYICMFIYNLAVWMKRSQRLMHPDQLISFSHAVDFYHIIVRRPIN